METRNGPYIEAVYLDIGSKVEIFYGRRSKTIVKANVLVESNLEDELAHDIARMIEGMTEEEIEAAFLSNNKKKRKR